MNVLDALAGNRDHKVAVRVKASDVKWGRPYASLDVEQRILALNPIGYWLGENTSSETINYGLTRLDGNGTIVGTIAVTDSILWLPKTTLVYAGSQHINYGLLDFADRAKYNLTLSAFIQPDTARTGEQTIFAKCATGTGCEVGLSITAANTLKMVVGDTLIGTYDPKFVDGEFAHVAVVVEGTVCRLVVNGVQLAEEACAITAIPTALLSTGGTLNAAGAYTSYSSQVRFHGKIEGFAACNYPVPVPALRAVYALGAGKTYYAPKKDWDTAPVATFDAECTDGCSHLQYDWTSYMTALNPYHWYKFDSDITTITDYGQGAIDGVVDGMDPDNIIPGAIYDSSGTGRIISGDNGSKFEMTERLTFGKEPTQRTNGFTLLFWTVRGDDYSRHEDDLLGTTDNRNGSGFYASIEDDAVRFVKQEEGGKSYGITVPRTYMPDVNDINAVIQRNYAMYVFTVDDDGYMRAYVNNISTSAVVPTLTPGIRVPIDEDSVFRIGHLGINDTAPPQGFDEVALFDRALSYEEINALYHYGRYGKHYQLGIIGSEDTSEDTALNGYTIADDPDGLPYLENEEDITHLVVGYAIDKDRTQFIDVGQLQLREGWETFDMADKLTPNKYITIEERITDTNGLYDSGWVVRGHFLVEGVPDITEEGAVNKACTVILKGVLNQTMFDLYVGDVRADTKWIERAVMEQTGFEDGVYEFRIPKPDSPDRYYINLASDLTPTLYASKFRNMDKESDSDDTYGEGEMPEHITIKSTNDAIQVLGGDGKVRINTNFYEAPLGEGLGDPDPDGGLAISFLAQASYADRRATKIRTIEVVDGTWCVTVEESANNASTSIAGITKVEEDAASVVYSSTAAGHWGHSGNRVVDAQTYGSDYHYTTAAGDTATYTNAAGVSADRIGFLAKKTSDAGIVIVEVDGSGENCNLLKTVEELVASDPVEYASVTIGGGGIPAGSRVIDLYGAGSADTLLFCADALHPGIHSIKLKATAYKRASSSSTRAQVSGFVYGAAKAYVDDSLYPTLYVDSGTAKSRKYKLERKVDAKDGRFREFQEATQSGTDLEWGTDSPAPTAPGFEGDGTPENALDYASLAAWTHEGGIGDLTNQLLLSGLNIPTGVSNERLVSGITLRMRRWCHIGSTDLSIGVFADGDTAWGGTGPKWLWWGADSAVKETQVQLTFDGIAIGTNYADTLREAGIATSAKDHKWSRRKVVVEEVLYGGADDKWGISTPISAADVSRLGVAVVAQCLMDEARAAVESIDVIVTYDDGSTTSTYYVLSDCYGNLVSPYFEGLSEGDDVIVGDANRPEDALRDLLLHSDMQNRDPSRPFYFVINDQPNELVSVMPAMSFSLQDERTHGMIITEILSKYVLPNYTLNQSDDGSSVFGPMEQKKIPDVVLDSGAYYSLTKNDSTFGVFTSVVGQSVSGTSINLARGSGIAVRALKTTNWATSDDTPSGKGEGSAYGKSYGSADADYLAMNARIAEMFDNSNRTPVLVGAADGWDKYNSLGVIWAEHGEHVYGYTMEDEPLFIVDIGTNQVLNKSWEIEAIQWSHIQTYKQKPGVSQVVSVYYMSDEAYLRLSGNSHQAIPSQDEADKSDSYFPDAASSRWKVLLDKAVCQNGQMTFEAEEFVEKKPVFARFLMFKLHQAHYYDGHTGNDYDKKDKRARAGFVNISVFSSKAIRTTATLGIAPGFDAGNFKQMLGRIRNRTYVLEPNGMLMTYPNTFKFTIDQLRELYTDFSPHAFSTLDPRISIGDTIEFVDSRNVTRQFFVSSLHVSNRSRVYALIDYRISPEQGVN